MSLSNVVDPDTDQVRSDTLAGSGSGSEKITVPVPVLVPQHCFLRIF
jgi:hypothetical protein